MTFLDMIPVSLTATYPRPYREEARAYAAHIATAMADILNLAAQQPGREMGEGSSCATLERELMQLLRLA